MWPHRLMNYDYFEDHLALLFHGHAVIGSANIQHLSIKHHYSIHNILNPNPNLIEFVRLDDGIDYVCCQVRLCDGIASEAIHHLITL